jgi:hypothetical protein
MFMENYRDQNAGSILGGGEATPIPYPKLSDEDWEVGAGFSRTGHDISIGKKLLAIVRVCDFFIGCPIK